MCRIVHPHRHNVGLPGKQIGSNIYVERGVSIMMAAGFLSIDIDGGLLIDSLEIE